MLVGLGAGLVWKARMEEIGATLAVAAILIQAIVWEAPPTDTRLPFKAEIAPHYCHTSVIAVRLAFMPARMMASYAGEQHSHATSEENHASEEREATEVYGR